MAKAELGSQHGINPEQSLPKTLLQAASIAKKEESVGGGHGTKDFVNAAIALHMAEVAVDVRTGGHVPGVRSLHRTNLHQLITPLAEKEN